MYLKASPSRVRLRSWPSLRCHLSFEVIAFHASRLSSNSNARALVASRTASPAALCSLQEWSFAPSAAQRLAGGGLGHGRDGLWRDRVALEDAPQVVLIKEEGDPDAPPGGGQDGPRDGLGVELLLGDVEAPDRRR